MSNISVKTGSSTPAGVGVFEKGHIGIELGTVGDEAIYSGDSDTLGSSNTVKLTNNYTDTDKTKVGNITVNGPVDLDVVGLSAYEIDNLYGALGALNGAVGKISEASVIPLTSGYQTITFGVDGASTDASVFSLDAANDVVAVEAGVEMAIALILEVEVTTAVSTDITVRLADSGNTTMGINSVTMAAGTIGDIEKIAIVVDAAALDVATNATLEILSTASGRNFNAHSTYLIGKADEFNLGDY